MPNNYEVPEQETGAPAKPENARALLIIVMIFIAAIALLITSSMWLHD